jgi:uncharacterized RDD family membrane protein YckC
LIMNLVILYNAYESRQIYILYLNTREMFFTNRPFLCTLDTVTSYTMILLLLFSVSFIFFNVRKRALHDFICGSFVVKVKDY